MTEHFFHFCNEAMLLTHAKANAAGLNVPNNRALSTYNADISGNVVSPHSANLIPAIPNSSERCGQSEGGRPEKCFQWYYSCLVEIQSRRASSESRDLNRDRARDALASNKSMTVPRGNRLRMFTNAFLVIAVNGPATDPFEGRMNMVPERFDWSFSRTITRVQNAKLVPTRSVAGLRAIYLHFQSAVKHFTPRSGAVLSNSDLLPVPLSFTAVECDPTDRQTRCQMLGQGNLRNDRFMAVIYVHDVHYFSCLMELQ